MSLSRDKSTNRKYNFYIIYRTQTFFPKRIDEGIAEDSPIRIINSVVDHLYLSKIHVLYSDVGCYGYHPRMMLKVACMNNIYSYRKIESLLLRDIHFIWLLEYQKLDFITSNRFRNRVKNGMNGIFTQIILVLASIGLVSFDTEYIYGTKIESNANKYTFEWRKSVEKNPAKLLEKIRILQEQIDHEVAQENLNEEKKV